jgi:glycerol uptake facilitator-like aquaporin
MNKYLVEFLGTAFFLYVILASGNAFVIATALVIAIMVGGKVSGGNYNPAVSIMMAAKGTLAKSDVLPYIVAQILGGLVALQLHKIKM